MAKKNLLKTGCGDWQLGWGLSGYDKIGTLELEPLTNSFKWKGYSQGRHGSQWNKGAWFTFIVTDGKIVEIDHKGNYPITDQLLEAVDRILRQQMNK